MTAASKWYATPRGARKRKPLTVTLSDEARGLLETLAGDRSLSEFVEELVRDRADLLARLADTSKWACHGQIIRLDVKCPVCRRLAP